MHLFIPDPFTRLHLVCGRDGRLRWADIKWVHYEHNTRRVRLHRGLAVVAHAGSRCDWVCDLGLSELLRGSRRDPNFFADFLHEKD